MCELNAEMQVCCVASIPTVENAWARGRKLVLHGWIYGMQDGHLCDLGPTLASAAERDALISMGGVRPADGRAGKWHAPACHCGVRRRAAGRDGGRLILAPQ